MNESRLPPGQQLAAAGKWPLVGERTGAPEPNVWTVAICGAVAHPRVWTLTELRNLPQTQREVDIHCVTRWSQLGMVFSGVLLEQLMTEAKPAADGRYISFVAHSLRNHSTSLLLDEALELETLVALGHVARPLGAEHGGPVRTIVPRRYFYKSLKWLAKIEVLPQDRLGYWEAVAGYHNRADPWREERFIASRVGRQEAAQILADRRMAGRDLMGLDAGGRNLAGLDARQALLRNANFVDAQLDGARFDGANLSNARLRGASLRNASFRDADLEGADFAGADLRGADLRGASLLGTSFMERASKSGPPRQALLDASTRLEGLQIEALLPEQAHWIRRLTEQPITDPPD
ncbi:MAG: molybdopterin-dependent oxidoreductase [Pirellulaceae bacterium]